MLVLSLPQRQTIASAGYDFECAQDIVLPSIWCMNFVRIFRLIRNSHELNERDLELAEKVLKPFWCLLVLKLTCQKMKS